MKRFFKAFIFCIICISAVITLTPHDVKIAEASAIKLNKTILTVDLGSKTTLKVTGTSKTAKWSSSNTKVATVSKKGEISALSQGTTTVTASVDNKKLTCKITVNKKFTKDWKDLSLKINDELYNLILDFEKFQDADWDFDISDYGYDSYNLPSGERFGNIFKLEHSEYDSIITVGLQNTDPKEKNIKKCKVWSVYINNKYAKNPVSITLPGGLKMGSTALDVLETYDDPDNSYKSEFGYWVYEYSIDNDGINELVLFIDDYIGLFQLEYSYYGSYGLID